MGEARNLTGDQRAREKEYSVIEAVLRRIEEIRAVDLDIRFDAAAAIDCSAEVCLLFVRTFEVLRRLRAASIVILEERAVRVIALDQAPARSVVVRDGERQCPAVGEREDSLNETFAETRFADNQPAVVILYRSGDYFGSRGRRAVD